MSHTLSTTSFPGGGLLSYLASPTYFDANLKGHDYFTNTIRNAENIHEMASGILTAHMTVIQKEAEMASDEVTPGSMEQPS